MTTLLILNEEIKDIMEMVKYLEKSGLLNKGVIKIIENKVRNKKESLVC